MEESTGLSQIVTTGWVVIGILLSLILPIAVQTLKKAKGLEDLESKQPTLSQRFKAAWEKYGGNRYLGIAAAATVVAVALVFLMGLEFSMARDAALAGFAWESFVNKLMVSEPA